MTIKILPARTIKLLDLLAANAIHSEQVYYSAPHSDEREAAMRAAQNAVGAFRDANNLPWWIDRDDMVAE
jgi:hypothetical protein